MFKKDILQGHELYILNNELLEVRILSLGAICTSIKYKGKEMTLWNSCPLEYLNSDAYMGAIIGRVANKIVNGRFILNDVVYNVDINDGNDQLHGGNNAFDKREYELIECGDNYITLKLTSKDLDNGFPGNLDFKVKYLLENESLSILFEAICDKDTIFAPTSHIYFRFNNKNMRYANLKINADKYVLNVGKENACIKDVEGVFDLREYKKIDYLYDDCYIFNDKHECYLEKDNILLTVNTDFDALQIYCGGELKGDYKPFDGIALEGEFVPDAINHEEFTKPIIKKDEIFNKYIKYSFKEI